MTQTIVDDIQSAIDRLLIAHGAYVPVELLLELGWLGSANSPSTKRR